MTVVLLAAMMLFASRVEGQAATYYVRETVGDDAHDGLSAQSAWRHISHLSTAMRPGDTAYVGPGLYREQISVANDGTSEGRLIFIADTIPLTNERSFA